MTRQVAYRLKLSELGNGEYLKASAEFEPNYLVMENGEKVNRVLVWGIVEEKFESKEKPFASITLNDFTASVKVLAFEDNTDLFKGVKPGQSVEVIGKIKEGNNGRFLLAESVKAIGFKEELLRRAENALESKRFAGKEKELKGQGKESIVEETELEIEKSFVGEE